MAWSKVVNTCPLCKARFRKVTAEDQSGKKRVVSVDEKDQQENEDDYLQLVAGLSEEEGYDDDDALMGYDSDGGFIVDEDYESTFSDELGCDEEELECEADSPVEVRAPPERRPAELKAPADKVHRNEGRRLRKRRCARPDNESSDDDVFTEAFPPATSQRTRPNRFAIPLLSPEDSPIAPTVHDSLETRAAADVTHRPAITSHSRASAADARGSLATRAAAGVNVTLTSLLQYEGCDGSWSFERFAHRPCERGSIEVRNKVLREKAPTNSPRDSSRDIPTATTNVAPIQAVESNASPEVAPQLLDSTSPDADSIDHTGILRRPHQVRFGESIQRMKNAQVSEDSGVFKIENPFHSEKIACDGQYFCERNKISAAPKSVRSFAGAIRPSFSASTDSGWISRFSYAPRS